MRIEYSPRFNDELFEIYLFISKLKTTIENIPPMPYHHRQSLKSDDKEVRDLVYEGYVIVYRIVQSDKRVDILGIFSENEWKI